jgi:hypothetical protein
MQSPLAPRDALLQQPVLLRLVLLLQQPQQGSVAEAAANMLGHCCTSASEVSTFAKRLNTCKALHFCRACIAGVSYVGWRNPQVTKLAALHAPALPFRTSDRCRALHSTSYNSQPVNLTSHGDLTLSLSAVAVLTCSMCCSPCFVLCCAAADGQGCGRGCCAGAGAAAGVTPQELPGERQCLRVDSCSINNVM